MDQLNISRISGRISGLTGYPAGYPAVQSGIRPDTGYKKGRIIRADIRRPDIRCIPSLKCMIK
jgi:hypothetical protein